MYGARLGPHVVGVAMKVVSLGGGHGQAAALSALRLFADEISAVVSVADDGGSSGRLVRELSIPPPGDARRNLLALSDDDQLKAVFDYRFKAGELGGHSLGNLILAGLTELEGDFNGALDHAGRLLRAHGRVYPAATEAVRLVADVEGERVEGQDEIKHRHGIRAVAIDPPEPPAPEAAVAAIGEADLVVVGPGSLFTSILPVLAVPAICAAVRSAAATRVLVCNLTVQAGETEGMDVAAHFDAFVANAGDGLVDVMLVNDAPVAFGSALGLPDVDVLGGVPLLRGAVAAERGAVHDPVLLAGVLEPLGAGRPGG